MHHNRLNPIVVLLATTLAACSPKEEARGGRVPGEIINSTTTAAAIVADQAPPPKDTVIREMRRRGIVPTDSARWTPDQYTLLLRCREAEKMGVFKFLRDKIGSLRGLAVEFQTEQGYEGLDLTARGYRKFIFVLSQEAFQYFESKGAEGQWVYQLKTLDRKRIFTDDGILTDKGVTLYLKVRRKIPAFWKFPSGRIVGTTRPPKDLLARVSRPNAFNPTPTSKPLPAPQSWSDPKKKKTKGLGRVKGLLASGFIELSEAEERHLLEKTRLSERQLQDKSSLQIIQTDEGVKYLISPSDPLMSLISRYRGGAAKGLPGAKPRPPKKTGPKPRLKKTPGLR
ncbi:MAG: hypothetical protein COB53_02070 [Elusimicrobia bacterium]|nr:MAG: hypothetical protein COB53_02070 [Elusimicrobiota bacterium]